MAAGGQAGGIYKRLYKKEGERGVNKTKHGDKTETGAIYSPPRAPSWNAETYSFHGADDVYTVAVSLSPCIPYNCNLSSRRHLTLALSLMFL